MPGVEAVLLALASLANAAIIGFIARRLLGAPVGWPRTILLALAVNAGAAPLLRWAADPLALSTRVPVHGVEAAQLALVTALIVAWLIVAEVVALAVLEAFVPTGSLPDPLAWTRSLPARSRRTRRYLQIIGIAAKHGLGRYLWNRRVRNSDVPASATAHALREALSEAGVTFVKLGQMLAARPDLLPATYVTELSRLQSDAPPQSWDTVRQTLEDELGRPVGEVFEYVEEQPLAAASVAQVHLARLRAGDEAVVKVQRSDARRQITADLDIVLRLAAWLHRRALWARRIGVYELAVGFAESLEEELDFTIELRNVQAVAAAAPASASVRVPTVHQSWSTRRVLVMERMSGRPLSSSNVLATLPARQRATLAEDLLSTVLQQIVVGGVFHADLHPGNVMIDSQARLGLLDFGSVGRLDRTARQSIGLLLVAVDRQDGAAATTALVDLLDRGDALEARALERDVSALIMRFGVGTASSAGGQMFVAMLRLVLRHGLSVPPQVAAAFRALGALEGTLQLLSPGLDMVSVARAQGRDLLRSQLGPRGVREQVEDQLVTALPLLSRLPRRLGKISEDLEAGRLTVTVRMLEHPRERAFLTGLAQQLVVAVLAAACALGGVLMVTSEAGPMMTTTLPLYTFLGFVLLLFAFVLGARAVVLVFRHATEPP
jgi:ubiquinone biosynthesis protein